MRYAIYYTPAADEPLARAAVAWLGRDAFGGPTAPAQPVASLSAAEVAFHTASARRYGFHATLKAPFRLSSGESEVSLRHAVDLFAASTAPVVIPRLKIAQLDGFLALVPDGNLPELYQFAGEVVSTFDRFRAPLTEKDIERRNPDLLTPMQFRYLHRWGYPYVFDAFRFHMTLSGRVGDDDAHRIETAIGALFGEALSRPIVIDALTVFVEPEPGAPFVVLSRHPLGAEAIRKFA
ncbi:DUF1045 domain-containing protein [Corticibacterium sp. UT-5YL-CI-8]|nr:DUF1045 domain-containing protein [Tianweitania sp. UT-5YL-CI-8]